MPGKHPSEDTSSPGQPGLSCPGLGAGLAILRDGKLLLYRRRKPPEAGSWNIPGGKIDHMEPSRLAATREAREETGLDIHAVEFLCHSEQIIDTERQHWLSLIYVCDSFTGEPRMVEPDRFHDFGWFAPGDLPMPLSRFAADAVAALASGGYFSRTAAS